MDASLAADRLGWQRASTAAVLGFAWRTGAFKADHAIAELGLTRSTTLAALDSLIDVGLVDEVDDDSAPRVGRPARQFQLRADAGVLVGLDAGGRRFTAMVSDLTGEVLAVEHLQLDRHRATALPDPDRRRNAALEVIDRALAAAGRARADVVAVAVGVPAPVDAAGRSPHGEHGFWAGMNADLKPLLAEHFPLVRLDNDAALAAWAEGAIGAASGCDDFVTLLSGRRLGSGVVLGGRLVRGHHGGVGEMAGFDHVAGVGGAWGLGELAENWLLEQLAAGRVPVGHPWHDLADAEISADRLVRDGDPNDELVGELFDHLAAVLGRVCTMLGNFYDPQVVVVAGAMAASLGPVIERAQQDCANEMQLPPPRIVASGLGGDVVGLGALAAARDEALAGILPLFGQRRA